MGNSRTIHQNILTQNRVIKNIMIYKLKVKLQKRIKKSRERDRDREHFFKKECKRE